MPEAIPDLREAGKCLAFELPNATAFHLHRANESVLRRYFEVSAKGITAPKTRNMGDYLKLLDEVDGADKKVIASLRDLKDLHRNPLAHPEDSLESIDEAIALLGAIQAVMVHMLKSLSPNPRMLLSPIPSSEVSPVGAE